MKRLARSTAWTEAKLFSYGPLLVWESMHQFCDKTSFHGLGGDVKDVACWHTCVSNSHLCIYGKMLQKPACIPRCAQPILCTTCVSNQTPRRASVIRPHVKSRDGRGWKVREETKQKKVQTCQIFAFGWVRMCVFFLIISTRWEKRRRTRRRRGQKCLSKWKIATIPLLLLL